MVASIRRRAQLAIALGLALACGGGAGTGSTGPSGPTGPTGPTGPVGPAGSPSALYAAARAACAAMPLRSTGTIHYFCDCRSGRQDACVAGDDAHASATDDAADCTDPAAPCRTFAQANVTFNRMAGGDTIAFCQGGAFEQAGSTTWENARCAPAADMRAPANSTTCDVRDYAPSWGGTAKPIIRQTTAGANLFQFWNTWTSGVRVLNLDFEGGGQGCYASAATGGASNVGRAALEVASASNVLVCNDTFNRWLLAANNNPSASPRNAGWDFYGNTVVMNALDAFLGGGDDFTYDANYLEDDGSCTATSHVIYPAGLNTADQLENRNLRIINNWIRFVNATCQGPVINGHGTYDGVQIENNFIDAAEHSNGGCWGMGIAPDSGYDKVIQYAKNMVFRRNRIESAGWHQISCASCPGAVVENNVIVSTAAALPYATLIAVPSAAARTIQPDPVTTGVKIVNNTIYAESMVTAISVPDTDVSAEGSGYVIANNAIHTTHPNAFCWRTGFADAAYAFVGSNACHGGTWDDTPASAPVTLDPLFTSPPAALTLQPGSPLAGKGAPAYAPALDFDQQARPSPPSIGAYEP